MNGITRKALNCVCLGLTKYNKIWQIQKSIVKSRIQSQIPDCLLITEHQPVITLGRGTDKNNLLVSTDVLEKNGIDICEIERGGDITFHGPGQTVLYPIIDLKNRGSDVRKYLRDLEQFAISAFSELGLQASTKEGLTGIWINDHKVGAIGVAVSRWITYHGIAINVNVDLDYFKYINPCGITNYPVGSLSQFLTEDISVNVVNDLLVKHFAEVFGYNIEWTSNIEELLIDRD